MKKLLILMLFFTLSCNDNSSSDTEVPASDESSTPSVETPSTPEPAPTPRPVPTPVPVPTTPSIPVGTDAWTEEFMDLINDHRRSKGLRALIHDDDMGAIAKKHSVNMASGTVAFGHGGFSTRCTQAKSALGGGNWCAENVAAGQRTPKDAFNSWMNSSGHKANIESSRATHTGFGYAKNSSGKYYWTQIFLEH